VSEPTSIETYEVVLPEGSIPEYPRAGRRVVEVDPPTIHVRMPELPVPSKAERERAAFLRLLPSLLATHAGQNVAVHNEQVVDSDPDDIALVRRVHARVGYVPIHVGLVTDAPLVTRMPRYREV